MAKIIDLKEYKKNLIENKVIEVDFKNKVHKKTTKSRFKKTAETPVVPFKKNEADGNDIA